MSGFLLCARDGNVPHSRNDAASGQYRAPLSKHSIERMLLVSKYGMNESMKPPAPQRLKLSLDHIFSLAADRHRNGRLNEAVGFYRMLIAFTPASAELLSNVCGAATTLERISEAVRIGLRAVRVEPTSAKAHLFLGQALSKQRDLQSSLSTLNRSVALEPSNFLIIYTLGVTQHSFGHFDAAAALYKRALILEPERSEVEHNMALALLTTGVFGVGWQHYLRRPSIRTAPYEQRQLPMDLQGERLVVIGDQGLGDEIFFLRFAPLLKARGARVTYCAHPKIASMVSRLPFLDQTVVSVSAIPAPVDRILSVGDLPYLLGHNAAADIPPPITLSPQPERITAIRQRLAALGPPPYLGVAWRAGAADFLFKQVPMATMAATLRGLPGTVVSLQRHPQAGEVEAFADALGAPVADLGGINEDLEGMLALLTVLDELVGVSNTNVHLRTALGRCARILVPFPPDFRWMAAGAQSPWFLGCPIYRQTPDLSWTQAFAQLRYDLENPAWFRPPGDECD